MRSVWERISQYGARDGAQELLGRGGTSRGRHRPTSRRSSPTDALSLWDVMARIEPLNSRFFPLSGERGEKPQEP